MAGCDAAINLVGVLNARGRSFHDAHVTLAEKVVNACRAQGVTRLLHMCALRANGAGPSQYLATKAEGEARVMRGAGDALSATSLRPSVVFGPGDSFFNRFATLLAMSPGFIPLACPQSKFAPVYVGDVAEAFVRCLEDESTAGKRFELAGPKVYTLRQIVEYTAEVSGLRRRVVGLGDGLSRLQAGVLGLLPSPPLSIDNYLSLQVDSVLTGIQRPGGRSASRPPRSSGSFPPTSARATGRGATGTFAPPPGGDRIRAACHAVQGRSGHPAAPALRRLRIRSVAATRGPRLPLSRESDFDRRAKRARCAVPTVRFVPGMLSAVSQSSSTASIVASTCPTSSRGLPMSRSERRRCPTGCSSYAWLEG